MGQKTGLFLRVDNFATVNGRKACDMSKVSEFCVLTIFRPSEMVVDYCSETKIAIFQYVLECRDDE